MRSRTSRGVLEWSGGKDLYMGSLILVAGKVSHFIGIVPGVPKGVRGSTKGVHQPRGATWAVGGAPWPIWAKGTSPKRPMRQEIRKRESPKGGRHLRGALGRKDSSLAAPFLGGRAKAAPPPLSLGPIYSGGKGEQQHYKPWRLPLPPVTPLPPRLRLAKPCRDPATSTTTPSCCWISINLSFPRAGSRRRRRRFIVRVLNAEVPSVWR